MNLIGNIAYASGTGTLKFKKNNKTNLQGGSVNNGLKKDYDYGDISRIINRLSTR